MDQAAGRLRSAKGRILLRVKGRQMRLSLVMVVAVGPSDVPVRTDGGKDRRIDTIMKPPSPSRRRRAAVISGNPRG